MEPLDFIRRWKAINQTERAVAHSHFIELCELLGEQPPTKVDYEGSWYCFERGAIKTTGKPGWADVWKRGCFGWEYKKKRRNLAEAQAIDTTEDIHAFHWPLAFPQVLARGGFDCVVGNPPWERIKLQEEEFFAARWPSVAEAPNKAERAKRIGTLAEAGPGTTERGVFEAFQFAKRAAEASSRAIAKDVYRRCDLAC